MTQKTINSISQALRDVYATYPLCIQAANEIDRLEQKIKEMNEYRAMEAKILADERAEEGKNGNYF